MGPRGFVDRLPERGPEESPSLLAAVLPRRKDDWQLPANLRLVMIASSKQGECPMGLEPRRRGDMHRKPH